MMISYKVSQSKNKNNQLKLRISLLRINNNQWTSKNFMINPSTKPLDLKVKVKKCLFKISIIATKTQNKLLYLTIPLVLKTLQVTCLMTISDITSLFPLTWSRKSSTSYNITKTSSITWLIMLIKLITSTKTITILTCSLIQQVLLA